MEDIGSNQNKNVAGLSFKDLSKEEKDSFNATSGEFLFVNEEIGEKNSLMDARGKFIQFINTRKQRKDVFAFVIELLSYVYTRFRVALILLSVLFDIFSDFINFFKDKIVKRMFWGRGTFLKSALQVTLSFMVFILIISYVYRRPVVIEASADTLASVGVLETDTIVATASLNTLVPKDRGRTSTIDYIVKRGDTISSIAAANNVSTQTVLWANDMSENDYLKLGQTLAIPPQDGVIVKVVKGDTVESLAKKYSANAADIVDAAWLEAPYKLTTGVEIFIPNGEMPTVIAKRTTTSTPSSYQQSSIKYSGGVADPNVGRFLGWPVGGPSAISRGFFSGHYGIDFYPTGGSRPSVVSACAGTVISAGWGYWGTNYGGYGYYTHVDCGNGYTILNGHMDKLYVSAGQHVGKGQALGLIGATGVAYGVHTHFELRRGAGLGGRINPAPYMQ
ncbi:MAG: LysM domain/M23/M37 peptidase domain protein [candidate division WS6 bacterium GW2011_GWF1_36_8]|uniref:LysM domain/M23/M37 peptidase domain protein n=1 Tax=candidate division WS6 bacterium GW2011_GWF1_36_8 TaxID=1619098 RepID=A0A0G0FHD2_9BACT|nr:MAG: LysM domain/M23/M37 peptidase domain protein [candidate division WS6 bacterium GW2011_GWF1_36_8]